MSGLEVGLEYLGLELGLPGWEMLPKYLFLTNSRDSDPVSMGKYGYERLS